MIRLDLEGPTPNQPHLTLCAMLRTYFMSLFSIVNSTIHSNSLLKHIFKWQKASSTTFYCRDCRIVSDNAWTQKTLYKIYDKREHNGCRNCSLYQGDQWYLVRPLILVCTCQPSCCVLSVALFEHVCKEKWWKQALWCLFKDSNPVRVGFPPILFVICSVLYVCVSSSVVSNSLRPHGL